MRHFRLWILSAVAVLCVGVSTATRGQIVPAQDNIQSISSEKAKENLITLVQPDYPPLAKAARIMGIVHASIEVDESGKVVDVKLLSGHPMLAPAALQAIRKWKYKPFEVGGKPVPVRTEVQVSIPENLKQSDIDEERRFQDAYWPNERAGREALKKGDLATAEAKLSLARAAAEQRADEKWMELASTISALATLKVAQNDMDGAEQLYKESLAVHLKHQRPDEAEVAGVQEALAILYLRVGEPQKAEPLLQQSVNSFEVRIKEISMPEARASYGQSLALEYFGLSQIAAANGRTQEASERCALAVSYAEKWSSSSDKDVIVTRCGVTSTDK